MRNQYIRIAPSTERPWCQWILPKKSQFLWDRLEPTKWQWSFENQKHGNSLAWAIGTFFAQVLSVNEFFEFSIDVGYALDMLVILLMKLMAIRVDPLQRFFFKDEAIPCDTKRPLIFSMWLSWVVYVGHVFWLVLQQEYWEHIMVHEFHGCKKMWFLEMLHDLCAWKDHWNARGKLTSESSPLTLFFVSFCLSCVSSLSCFFYAEEAANIPRPS